MPAHRLGREPGSIPAGAGAFQSHQPASAKQTNINIAFTSLGFVMLCRDPAMTQLLVLSLNPVLALGHRNIHATLSETIDHREGARQTGHRS